MYILKVSKKTTDNFCLNSVLNLMFGIEASCFYIWIACSVIQPSERLMYNDN